MSETIEAATPAALAPTELSIAFTTEELVVLGRVLGEQLGVLGPAPLAAIAPSAREDVLASAARSLRARNVLSGPADQPAVDRAVAGLIQIAARPALRAELTVDRGSRLHRRYLAIPYASVQYELIDGGLHRLTPFATTDLLARMMRHADFVERPAAEVDGFELPYATLRRVEQAAAVGDLAGARTAFGELAAADPSGPAIAPASIEQFIAALAGGPPVNAVRLVHAASPTRSVGGEVAWIDGGAAGIWQLPTIDQPFAVVGATDGLPIPSIDPEADAEQADRDRHDLDAATVRVEPVAATDLAQFLFGLLPAHQVGAPVTGEELADPTPSPSG